MRLHTVPKSPPRVSTSPTRAPSNWRAPLSPRSCYLDLHYLGRPGGSNRVSFGLIWSLPPPISLPPAYSPPIQYRPSSLSSNQEPANRLYFAPILSPPSKRITSPFNRGFSMIWAVSMANSTGRPRRFGKRVMLTRDS